MNITKKLPYIIFFFVLLMLGLGIFYVAKYLHKGHDGKKIVAQQITLITPPPPPPPPPEKPPEVEQPKIQEEVPQEQPQEAQEEAPAGQDLGVDAEGGAGSDSFGLVGHKGGTGLGLGKAGHYEGMVREKIQDFISENEELNHMGYTAVITVWIGSNGKIERYSISLEDGSPKAKKILESLVVKLSFESGPPIEQAGKGIKFRVRSRI